jgi:hypothetical protein
MLEWLRVVNSFLGRGKIAGAEAGLTALWPYFTMLDLRLAEWPFAEREWLQARAGADVASSQLVDPSS